MLAGLKVGVAGARMAVVVVVAALGLPSGARAQIPTKTFTPQDAVQGMDGTLPPPGEKTLPPATPVAPPPVATAVEQIGSSAQVAGAWAGDVVNPDGTVTAYVTPAGEAALASALASSVGAPSAGYTIVTVPRSMDSLQTLTDSITADLPALTTEGIRMASYGPDAGSDTVRIDLDPYTPDAAKALVDRYGATAITVAPTDMPGATFSPASRSQDTRPPWFNGDPIFYKNNRNDLCTLGFGFRGNRSGHLFNATAGHCGPDGQFTNYAESYIIGHTSTNYWTPRDSTDDIQSITAQTSYTHETWYSEDSYHEVIGWSNFGVNSLVTMDGFASGEHPRWTVKKYNTCVPWYDWSDGYTRCHISEATNTSARSCYQGDSGGPVYQRTSNNNVYAAGLIVGGSDDHHTCWYFGIGQFRSLVNGTLLTSTGRNG